MESILPRVLENLRLQIGPAMVFLIAAEWSFAGEGMGYTIKQQSKLQNMHVVYIYLAILGFLGCYLTGCWFRRVASFARGLENSHG